MCFLIALGLFMAAFLSMDDIRMAIGLVGLGILSAVIGWDFRPVRHSHVQSYKRAKIVAVRVGRGSGSFVVEADHNQHVTNDLELPPNATVTIMGDGTYHVEFPTVMKTTPDEWSAEVYTPAGEKRTHQLKLTQADSDRAQVEDWARSNGYEGRVQ